MCVWLVSWCLPPAVPQIPWELCFVCVYVWVGGQRELVPEGPILWRCFAITCQAGDMSPRRRWIEREKDCHRGRGNRGKTDG